MSAPNYRLVLPDSHVPTSWYNMAADLPGGLPAVLHPGTHQPIGPADLAPLFPMDLIMQEVSQDRYIPIPDEVREMYRHLPSDPAGPGSAPGKGAGHAGAHLLQE